MKKYNFVPGLQNPSEGGGNGDPAEGLSPRAKRLAIIGGIGIVLVGTAYVYTTYFVETIPPPQPPISLQKRGSPPQPLTPPAVKQEDVQPPLAVKTPLPERRVEVTPPVPKDPTTEVSATTAKPTEGPRESPRPPELPTTAETPPPQPVVKVTKPAVTAKREYSIQIASLVRERNVISLTKRLEKLGYHPIVRKTTVPLTRHRVYAGEFSTREEAERVARKLNVDGFPSNLVEIEPGKFGLEVGSSFNLNDAIDIARSLQKKEYNPKIVSVEIPTAVHQVRVGEYENRQEALKEIKILKEHGFKPLIVKP